MKFGAHKHTNDGHTHRHTSQPYRGEVVGLALWLQRQACLRNQCRTVKVLSHLMRCSESGVNESRVLTRGCTNTSNASSVKFVQCRFLFCK